MPQSLVTLTPIDADVEERIISFDYGSELTSGAVVTGVISLSCTLLLGTDPFPQNRVLSPPAIVDAPAPPVGTGIPSAAIAVIIGEMVAGATYLLQCVVQCSDEQHLSIWQKIDCIQPS